MKIRMSNARTGDGIDVLQGHPQARGHGFAYEAKSERGLRENDAGVRTVTGNIYPGRTRWHWTRSALIFLLFSLATLLNSSVTSAHVLEASGSIGAILHIDPDDDPIAGQTNTFFFELKDKQNKFQPGLCDCQLSIIRHDQELVKQSLIPNQTNTLSGSFIFPEKDIYTIQLDGKPLSPDAFQPFHLSYDIRVARTGGQPESTEASHTSHLLLGILFLGLLFGSTLIRNVKSNKKGSQ